MTLDATQGLSVRDWGLYVPSPQTIVGFTCGAVGAGNGQGLKILWEPLYTFPANVAKKRLVLKGLDIETSPIDTSPLTLLFSAPSRLDLALETSGLEHFAFDRDSVLNNEKMLIEDAQQWT